MKRMREISIACIALMLLLTAVTIPYALANGTCAPIADLIAGGGAGSGDPKSETNVGEVWVGVCAETETLHVTYVITNPGWCLYETHLHVGEYEHVGDFTVNIPQTKKGNPIPGKFDYKGEHDCVTWYQYEIALSELDGNELVIAAHAVVCNECGCGCETAWGAGNLCPNNGFDFPGKNWATGFTYTVDD